MDVSISVDGNASFVNNFAIKAGGEHLRGVCVVYNSLAVITQGIEYQVYRLVVTVVLYYSDAGV